MADMATAACATPPTKLRRRLSSIFESIFGRSQTPERDVFFNPGSGQNASKSADRLLKAIFNDKVFSFPATWNGLQYQDVQGGTLCQLSDDEIQETNKHLQETRRRLTGSMGPCDKDKLFDMPSLRKTMSRKLLLIGTEKALAEKCQYIIKIIESQDDTFRTKYQESYDNLKNFNPPKDNVGSPGRQNGEGKEARLQKYLQERRLPEVWHRPVQLCSRKFSAPNDNKPCAWGEWPHFVTATERRRQRTTRRSEQPIPIPENGPPLSRSASARRFSEMSRESFSNMSLVLSLGDISSVDPSSPDEVPIPIVASSTQRLEDLGDDSSLADSMSFSSSNRWMSYSLDWSWQKRRP